MAEHTPTPWSVEMPMDEEFAIVQSGLEAYEWQFIAVCPVTTPSEGGFPRQQAKANAAFIVKAVNSHDALVKALEWYAQDYNYELGCSQWDGGSKARAALALCEQEGGSRG
jgi:hypothetical protein